MIRQTVACFVVALALLGGTARAKTLVVPENLVDLTSQEGEHLLRQSGAFDAYVRLSSNFVTQQTQSFCGVASMVMVLNALDVAAPTTPAYAPYHIFTQDNVLDEHTEAILPREVVMRQGMTLDQLGGLLQVHGVMVEVHHAADGTLEAFRASARENLGRDRAVIVNYLRKVIGEERGGHISPLAGYDPSTDRFLILDVARYKYPPVWVRAADLFAAMNTVDADNQNLTRGYVLVQTAQSPAVPQAK